MIKESITIQEVADLLNSAVAADQETMQRLVELRLVCNQSLAEHETIQVKENSEEGTMNVGILGIINGMFGVSDKGGALGAVYEVVCAHGHDTEVGQTICNKCNTCGSNLKIGKLLRFQRSLHANK